MPGRATNPRSEGLTDSLDKLATYGKSKIALVIGVSLGLSEDIEKINQVVFFFKNDFPHWHIGQILVEQISGSFGFIGVNLIISKSGFLEQFLEKCSFIFVYEFMRVHYKFTSKFVVMYWINMINLLEYFTSMIE